MTQFLGWNVSDNQCPFTQIKDLFARFTAMLLCFAIMTLPPLHRYLFWHRIGDQASRQPCGRTDLNGTFIAAMACACTLHLIKVKRMACLIKDLQTPPYF